MAKLYCAKNYVQCHGAFFHPGEVFETDAEPAEINRLLRLNAICECEMVRDIPMPLPEQDGIQKEAVAEEVIPDVAEVDALEGVCAPKQKKGTKK